MSTSRSIGLTVQRKVLRPVKLLPRVEQKIIENPSMDDLTALRSDGWCVAFETFAISAKPNGGIAKCHFVRLEKVVQVKGSGFAPDRL